MRGMHARDRIMTVLCVVRGIYRRFSSGTLIIMMGLITELLWGVEAVLKVKDYERRSERGGWKQIGNVCYHVTGSLIVISSFYLESLIKG
jgi:hypothetical protein